MRRHTLFFGVLVFAAVSRFYILFHSQTHVHSDEAIIGLMGKHILDGSYYPFYMYGQDYNAAGAWEAYLAAASFAIFGLGVVPLKGCIVVLSLVCLGWFYRMVCALYGLRTAALAALVFALSPSLLKWHFQVRGYSWYFLSLPVLTCLFLSMESRPVPRPGKLFCFGLVSGLSLWGLELGLTFNAALWLLLALRGKLPARNALAGLAGFLAGYLPALLFNLTHHSSNWQQVFFEKTGGEMTVFHVGTLAQIFVREMPKFFGPDTVFWYCPETPAFGPALYLVALLAVAAVLWPFLKNPGKIGSALCGRSEDSGKNGDILMLTLVAACFIPYLAAPIRVPGYYLGGIFPLSVLIARLVARCLSATRTLPRILGATLLLVVIASGVHALLSVGGRNQIETLTQNQTILSFRLVQIPGRDISAVERHLRENQVTSVWTTMSLVYPLVFESDETLAVSSEIFGITIQRFPPTLPERKPDSGSRAAFVVESDSPNRARAEELCRKVNGTAPLVTDCGALIIFEGRARPDSRP